VPDKPTAQLIREVSVDTAEALTSSRAWAEYGQREIARLEAFTTKTADALKETEKKLAAVEERVNETKRVLDEIGRRRFTLLQGVLCVVLGGVLAFLFQLAFTYFKARLGAGP
jgi:hypothetical protein